MNSENQYISSSVLHSEIKGIFDVRTLVEKNHPGREKIKQVDITDMIKKVAAREWSIK